MEEAWRPSCDQSDILRSLQGTDSVVVGLAAHHVHLDGVSDVGTEIKLPELNLRCSSARPNCGPIWAESKPNYDYEGLGTTCRLPLRMPAHVFSHLLDHSLLHLLPPPALNVPAGRAPREASEGGAGKKAADGDERAAEHGPASARNSGHREGGACGQGGTAIEG